MTLVPCLAQHNLLSYPKNEDGGRVRYVELGDFLTRNYTTDVHTAGYSFPQKERRLCLELLHPKHTDLVPDGVPMVLAIFDVDCETSHKASGAKTPAPAPDEWWVAELEKIRALLVEHPDAFIYRTRGGYRVVYLIEPIVLRKADDADVWKTTYTRWVAYLARRFSIFADAGCKEWTRLFRAPHATRDKETSPEQRETIGDPHAIGVWECTPSDEDCANAIPLKKTKEKKERTPKPVKPACNGEGILFHAFKARGELGKEIEPSKWAVVCPNEKAHSKGERFDTSTILFAPRLDEGESLGWLHCSHGHCVGRTVADAIAHFTKEEMAAAKVAAGVVDQPPQPVVALIRNSVGLPHKCVANVMTVLTRDLRCAGCLMYDEFCEDIAMVRPLPCREHDAPKTSPKEFSKEVATRFAAWLLEEHDLDVTSGQVTEAVVAVARRDTQHAVRDQLSRVQHDGVSRVDSLFVRYFRAKDTTYTRGIAQCFMVSAVARIFEPGCQADYCVVAEGKQGIGKSSGWRALFGADYFTDSQIPIGEKDGYQQLRNKWGICFDEIDAYDRKTAGVLKNFLSSRTDRYRPSYGERPRDFQRQSVAVATTNKRNYLTDDTGGRRFHGFQCERVDVAAIERDRLQLWAEAVALYRAGARRYPDAALEKLCQDEQADRRVSDPWAEIVEEWLDDPKILAATGKFEGDRLSGDPTSADILVHALRKRPGEIQRPDEQRIGAIMRSLGYDRQRRRDDEGDRRYYWVEDKRGHIGVNGTSGKHHADPIVPNVPSNNDDGSRVGEHTAAPTNGVHAHVPGVCETSDLGGDVGDIGTDNVFADLLGVDS